MKSRRARTAFTKLELLFVIGLILFVLAIVIPPTRDHATRAPRLECINNLRRLHDATQTYLYDWSHETKNTNATLYPFLTRTDYRVPIQENLGPIRPASPKDSYFACPKDTFYYATSNGEAAYISEPLHEQSNYVYTSYAYNAGYSVTPGTNNSPAKTNFHGIAGMKLESVAHPSRTVMLAEVPAFAPYSWHRPKKPLSEKNSKFNDSRNVLSFVDGHAEYTRMYYSGQKLAWDYNPPAGYDYQWSGD